MSDLFDDQEQKEDEDLNKEDEDLNKETLALFQHPVPDEGKEAKEAAENLEEDNALFRSDEEGPGIMQQEHSRTDIPSNKKTNKIIFFSALAMGLIFLIIFGIRSYATRSIHQSAEKREKAMATAIPDKSASEAEDLVYNSFDRYQPPETSPAQQETKASTDEGDAVEAATPVDLRILRASERLSNAAGGGNEEAKSGGRPGVREEEKTTLSSEENRIRAAEAAENERYASAMDSTVTAPPSGKTKISGERYDTDSYQLRAAQRETLDPDLTIAQGTFIPCVLQTKIVSTIAGEISCVVPDDVYSESGHVLLIEKGSRVFGVYESGELKAGENRIFVIWQKLRTPDHLNIALASNATDPLGASGVLGQVDEHFGKRFGTALLVSALADLSKAATNAMAPKSKKGANAVNISSNSDEATGIITSILQKEMQIQPTLYKNQGETVGIMVARDLDFSGVYGLRFKDKGKGTRPW